MYRVEIYRNDALVFEFSAKVMKPCRVGMLDDEYTRIEDEAIEKCEAHDVDFDSDSVSMLIDGHEYEKRTPKERDFDRLPLYEALHKYSGCADEIEIVNKYSRRAGR